jgi:pimeloyl-ACP methyl ester carboxylesterase
MAARTGHWRAFAQLLVPMAAVALTGSTALVGCKERVAPTASAAKADGEADVVTTARTGLEGPVDQAKFRDMFLGAALERYGAARFKSVANYLMYSVPDELVAEPTDASATASAEAYFAAQADRFRAATPMSLYRHGASQAAQPYDARELTKALATLRDQAGEPLFLVIVPGVFGEFIDTRAFEEIYEPKPGRPSSSDLRASWLSRSPQTHKDLSLDEPLPLDQLLSVTSVDDAQGKALARIMLFNTPRLSLESLGDIESRAEIFTRRMEQAFRILGYVPKNLALLGYSRGTMVALEMLSQAQTARRADAQAHSWVKSVRAVISLGGVVYGSAVADEQHKPGTTTARQIARVSQFLTELDDAGGWYTYNASKKIQVSTANNHKWVTFLKDMIRITFPDLAEASAAQLLALAKDKIKDFQKVDPGPSAQMLAYFWDAYDLWKPYGDAYPHNIRKFKRLTRSMLTAVGELTETARLDWWRSHTVPAEGVTYYSITGTMADTAPLKENPATGIPGGADDAQLLTSYLGYVKSTLGASGAGLTLNDSQVSLVSARFWPAAARLLNPQQEPMKVTYLGVVGTSHWGLALREVNKMASGAVNPFPREDLLRSLLATVALDLSAGPTR